MYPTTPSGAPATPHETAGAPAAAPPAEPRRGAGAFVLLGTVQATLIAAITLLTVAVPAIQADLEADDDAMVLTASAYGLAFGALLMLAGRLADLLGHRRLFVCGMAVFGVASALAGLAPSPTALVAARLAQGVGAALTAPAAMALVPAVVPSGPRRVRAMALWGVLSGIGGTAGTVLSGLVTTWAPWRWVFAFPVLVAAIAVPAARRLLPADGPPRRASIDWIGAALAAAALATVIYGLHHSAWAALAGAVLLALFALAEHRSAHPLVPPAFLAGRTLALLAVAACSGAMAAASYLLSLFLQQERGMSALETSVLFLLSVPAVFAAGHLTGRLTTRLSARAVLTAGLVTAAAGFALAGFLHAPYAGLVLFPLGCGLAFSAAALTTVHGTRDDQAGMAGSLFNTAMEIGPPLALTISVALAAARSPHPETGYAFALRAMAITLLALALCTHLFRTTRARSDKHRT